MNDSSGMIFCERCGKLIGEANNRLCSLCWKLWDLEILLKQACELAKLIREEQEQQTRSKQ